MIKIFKNKKLKDGYIERKYSCDFQFEGGCNGQSSLYLIKLEERGLTKLEEKGLLCTNAIICKSCLNYLISKIDNYILDELFHDK